MSISNSSKKWDVAISFLLQDIAVAEALFNELSKGLRVFFSPRRQEDIAGTDGVEIFRQTFFTDSRLNVGVYRQRWGTTPWTAVEANAIRDSCVQNQFRNIFVFNVEDTSIFPDWLPHNHMRFDLGEYTLEQVVGAIKLRVAEQGGRYEPLTPLKQAQIMKAEEEFNWERSGIKSLQNLPRIHAELEKLLVQMAKQCGAIRKDGALDLECEINGKSACILRCEQAGLIARWDQRYQNSLEESHLTIEHYRGHLRFNSDPQLHVHYFPPDRVKSMAYEPDMSRSRDYGWSLAGKGAKFVASETLAQNLVMEFLELVGRERNRRT